MLPEPSGQKPRQFMRQHALYCTCDICGNRLMATGSERPKVTRHTTLWMGSNNLRFLCRNRSLQVKKAIKGNVCVDRSRMTTAMPRVIFRSGEKHCADLGERFCTISGWEICPCESSSSGVNGPNKEYILFHFQLKKMQHYQVLFKYIKYRSTVYGKHMGDKKCGLWFRLFLGQTVFFTKA